MTLPPKAHAQKDFKGGCGQSDNPYLPDTPEFEDYAWEMHRLWNQELADLRQAVNLEGLYAN